MFPPNSAVITSGHDTIQSKCFQQRRNFFCWAQILLVLMLGLAPGCADESRRQLGLVLPDPLADHALGQSDAKPANRASRRAEKKKKKPVPLYADGRFYGTVRYKELPAAVPSIWQQLKGGKYVLRFAWIDVFEAHGIDVDAIKTLQFYGGKSLVCVITGQELRRLGRKLRFSYSRGRAGHVRMEFPNEPVEKNVWLDRVVRVELFLQKPAPKIDEKGIMRMPSGELLPEHPPYSDGERHGGTRLYVDDVFKGSFRRRALTAELQVDAGDPTSPYSLAKGLKTFGVDIMAMKQVRFSSRIDRQIGELQGDLLARTADQLVFRLPQHSRGRIVLPVFEDQKIEAITMYDKVSPDDRPMPQLSGSPANQAGTDNSNHIVVPYVAQPVQ